MYLTSTARGALGDDETFDVTYEPAHTTTDSYGTAFTHPASIDVRPSERGMYLSLSLVEAWQLLDALTTALKAAHNDDDAFRDYLAHAGQLPDAP